MYKKKITVKRVSFNMIHVTGGTFMMGALPNDANANDDEKPAHAVTLSNFFIGETEVTQELWETVMDFNPSDFTNQDQLPVECVSWNFCQEFIRKLNLLTGMRFRLPTEAEWEFAARGGNESLGYKYSGSNEIGDVAWYDGNSNSTTHPVKQKQANELGIYDMCGNVSEWCSDRYGDYSSSSQTDPTGSSFGTGRINRGGSWIDLSNDCRSSSRSVNSRDRWFNNVGLRLALSE